VAHTLSFMCAPISRGTKLLGCPTPPRWSPGSAVLISLPGTSLIPRLRSGFRQRAQTPAKRLNFG